MLGWLESVSRIGPCICIYGVFYHLVVILLF